MRYLVDTVVVSELRQKMPNDEVVRFVGEHQDSLWLSSLTIGELLRGVHAMNPGRRREELRRWLSGIESRYELRILPVDVETALIWGRLSGDLRRRGIQLPLIDGLIAATALQHGMSVVTRNVKDFEPTGVTIVNPWQSG